MGTAWVKLGALAWGHRPSLRSPTLPCAKRHSPSSRESRSAIDGFTGRSASELAAPLIAKRVAAPPAGLLCRAISRLLPIGSVVLLGLACGARSSLSDPEAGALGGGGQQSSKAETSHFNLRFMSRLRIVAGSRRRRHRWRSRYQRAERLMSWLCPRSRRWLRRPALRYRRPARRWRRSPASAWL